MNDYDSLSYESLKLAIENIRAINNMSKDGIAIRPMKLIMIADPGETAEAFELRVIVAKKLAKDLIPVCVAQSVGGK